MLGIVAAVILSLLAESTVSVVVWLCILLSKLNTLQNNDISTLTNCEFIRWTLTEAADRSRCIETSTVSCIFYFVYCKKKKKKKSECATKLQLNCEWNSTTFWVTNFQHNANRQDWKKIQQYLKGNSILIKDIEQLQYQVLDTLKKKQFPSDDVSDIA